MDFSPHAKYPIKKKKITINDEDRRQWVQNDQGLYRWWKSSRMGLYRFVNENRSELTKIIMKKLNEKPGY